MADPSKYAGIWPKGSLKALGEWLASCRPLWVFLGGLIIPVAMLNLVGVGFRSALLHGGFFLQILSIILIVCELNRLRIYWGKPGFPTSIKNKLVELGRIIFRKRKSMHLKPAPINVTSYVSAPTVIAGETIEDRLRRLERQLNEYKKQHRQELSDLEARLYKKVEEKEIRENKEKKENASRFTQNLNMELVAALWLLSGILMSWGSNCV
ncbi:hypothetical protein [Marinobacter sp. ATCH36]|uniref:hypothetical protein n=1 Tax=Marinobacter sp. ATCH36 TaxID=2945106 RepID=UPI00202118B8|nr:hypothetical protein [Marinobacter sp. ATCH36]MCL7942919.1 hypothetical protein [Marinobacter sp. ATCH36]